MFKYLNFYQIWFIVIILNTGCSYQVIGQVQKDDRLKNISEGGFSIVVIPDTQEYFGKGTKKEPDSKEAVTNPVFLSQTQWIAKNIDRQNIVFVSHVGDIVDKNNDDQWKIARENMDLIHGLVPYGVAVGNHDMTLKGNSSLFQKYFPAKRFDKFSWYGGYFNETISDPGISGNNANSFQLFSANGIDFVILHIECNAPNNVIEWANDVMDQYKDRFAIITSHMVLGPLEKPLERKGYYTDPKGIMKWVKIHGERGNSAQELWEKLFARHKNLKLVFCGDQSRTNSMYINQYGESGNRVDILLSDYMVKPGPLRLYRFYPNKSEIEVVTFNTLKNKIMYNSKVVPDPKMHNFKLLVDFEPFMKK